VAHYKPNRRSPEGKLLVVIPSKYVGNMVISLRTLAAIIEQVEDATLIIDENFEPLVRSALGENARLITWPRGGERRFSRAYRFVRELRSTRYDDILDMDGTVLSGRVTRLARGKRKTGPGFAKRTGVYDRIIRVDRDSQHCFDDYVELAASVGIEPGEATYLPLPGLAERPLPFDVAHDRPVVCMHPSATKDYKQWEIDKFARTADELAGSGCQVVIIGAGDSERARVDRLLARASQPLVDAHGRLSLMDLVFLFKQAHLYIGNDSGPMHLAAASGIPVIALFGPTELIRWRPRVSAVTILKGPAPCAEDCKPEDCKRNYQCLTSLPVDDVVARASEIVAGVATK